MFLRRWNGIWLWCAALVAGEAVLQLGGTVVVNQTEEWRHYRLENGLRNMRVEVEVTGDSGSPFALLMQPNNPPSLQLNGNPEGHLMDIDGWNFTRQTQHIAFAVTSDTHLYYVAVYAPAGRLTYKLRAAVIVSPCPSYCPDKQGCQELVCVCRIGFFGSACTERLQTLEKGANTISLEAKSWYHFTILPKEHTEIINLRSFKDVDCCIGYG
jgi:hypothetical protein